MQERLITFEIGQLAKEKGFNIPCDNRWWIEPCSDWKESKKGAVQCTNSEETSISRPTLGLLQQWLREIHNIEAWVIPLKLFASKKYQPHINNEPLTGSMGGYIFKNNYHEALELSLLTALTKI